MSEVFLFFRPGLKDLFEFIANHLFSGMVPAFFIAGAIAVFLDKEKVTRFLGPKAHPVISYPLASFAGAVLTVCSCGVIPIFTGIMQRGAGTGPAFTFLFAAPAINLIALTYTYTFFGLNFTIVRLVSVLVCAILIGFCMKLLFGDPDRKTEPTTVTVAEDDDPRPVFADIALFGVLLLIMLTTTGIFDPLLKPDTGPISTPMLSPRLIGKIELTLIKLLVVFAEVLLLSGIAWFHFRWAEIEQWLKKSKDLFLMILPKVLLGIFFTGLLSAHVPLTAYLSWFSTNDIQGNLLMGIIGSLMYFGTIVGVNIVKMLVNYGMHMGPALTLFLSGPSVSFPSLLAIAPIVGTKRALAFFVLVVIFASASGLLYGSMF